MAQPRDFVTLKDDGAPPNALILRSHESATSDRILVATTKKSLRGTKSTKNKLENDRELYWDYIYTPIHRQPTNKFGGGSSWSWSFSFSNSKDESSNDSSSDRRKQRKRQRKRRRQWIRHCNWFYNRYYARPPDFTNRWEHHRWYHGKYNYNWNRQPTALPTNSNPTRTPTMMTSVGGNTQEPVAPGDASNKSPAPSHLPSTVPSTVPTQVPSPSPSEAPSNEPSSSVPMSQESLVPTGTETPTLSNVPSGASNELSSSMPSADQQSGVPTESTQSSSSPSELPARSVDSSSTPTTLIPLSPSEAPAVVTSNEPSMSPTDSVPTRSPKPSQSSRPSQAPSTSSVPTRTAMPSDSTLPSSTPSISLMPSDDPPSPAPSASPTSRFENTTARVSGVFGASHLITFDGLEYDCQAAGEFVMLKSLESDFEIREKFTSVNTTCTQATVSTGFVVKANGVPDIQISMYRAEGDYKNVNGCHAAFLQEGNFLSTSSDSFTEPMRGGAFIFMDTNEHLVGVEYPDIGLQVIATVHNSDDFGCYFRSQVILPFEYLSNETLVGLLGTPNDDSTDDWVAPDGTALLQPARADDLLFSAAYDYCTTNWCISNQTDSLFQNAAQTGGFVSGCNVSYNDSLEQKVETELSSDGNMALKNICCESLKNDDCELGCLIDGICGSPTDAENSVEDHDAIFELKELVDRSTSFPTPVPQLVNRLHFTGT